jgi:hypothetical protein
MVYVLRAGLEPPVQEKFRRRILDTHGARRFGLCEAFINSS